MLYLSEICFGRNLSLTIISAFSRNEFLNNALQGFRAESIDWNYMDRHLHVLYHLSLKANRLLFRIRGRGSNLHLCPVIDGLGPGCLHIPYYDRRVRGGFGPGRSSTPGREGEPKTLPDSERRLRHPSSSIDYRSYCSACKDTGDPVYRRCRAGACH